MRRTSDWSGALIGWCAPAEADTREHDLLTLGASVTLDLFVENHRPRGDLRRWTVIYRGEVALRSGDSRGSRPCDRGDPLLLVPRAASAAAGRRELRLPKLLELTDDKSAEA